MSKPSLYSAIDLDEPLTLDYDKAFEALCSGEVKAEHGLLRWGSNYTFLVTVRHQDLKFMGVYKPRIGERPLWDFPDGTLCQRETASYVLSEALGWYLVPPTVLREGPRGIGSLQVFINHDPNQHYFAFPERQDYADILPQLQKMALFDALNNNADRKGGHCLLDDAVRLWGIDHGLCFHPAHKLRTVIWDFAGQAIPPDMLQRLNELCEKLSNSADEHRIQLDGLINSHEMTALRNRLDKLVQTGKYPMPGPGPNRPWPAV
jgi:uncharacterized repeat protein (TIGR03843 family)